MALELVGGAVLGVVFDQLQKEIWRVKDNVAMFRPKLEELEETLDILSPVIQEIEELNRRLNRPNHGRETIILRRLLEDGTKLVSKCSKIPSWDFLKQSRYREKLMELDNKILRFHNLYMQAHMGRDQKKTLLFMQETRQMLIMSLNQQGFSNITMGITASSAANSSDLTTASSSGSSSNITMSITASSAANSSDLTTASSAGPSSNITMSITASSTGSSYKKIVMMMHMDCEKSRTKILKVVATANGVNSVILEGDDRNKLVVIGDKVDPAQLMKCLRKKVGYAEIISVGQQQPNTIENHTPKQRSLTLCLKDMLVKFSQQFRLNFD